MKRLFTIIFSALMMLTGVQSVSAQSAIFSLETTGDGNATTGTFDKKGVNTSDDTQDPKRWTMKSTGAYIQCTCSQAIAEGDEIAITGTPQSTSTSGFYIRLEGDNNADAVAGIKASGKKKEQTRSYTVEAGSKLIGQTTIYVMMEQQNRQWWINKIEVLGGTATGLSSVATDKVKTQEAWYDLQGHKVTAPQKGNIYLKNGKKIIF